MENQDFTAVFTVDQTPKEVFGAINNVRGWWSEDFQGHSQESGQEFDVRFGDVHYSRQRLTEVIPNEKVVWLVTDSRLNFLTDKSEWTNTTIRFEIAEKSGKTELRFTHVGLTPKIECFRDCSNGWNQFLEHSLLPLIATGKGNPNVLQQEIDQKSVN